MTGHLRTPVAFYVVAFLTVAGTLQLAVLGNPWLAGLTAWVGFLVLAVILGGRWHAAHHQTATDHVGRIRHATNPKENHIR